MNCKNCGTRLSEKAKVCPNCGAFVDDSSGYTLLAADDRMYDVYSSEKKRKNKKKKSSVLGNVIVFLLILIIGGGTVLFYLNNTGSLPSKQPELSFNQGSGIINKNDKVIYVLFEKGSDVKYIQGVSLYNYDRTKLDEIREPISTDYEYTKSIDSTFRAIYFDTKDFNIVDGEKYTYTFEMKLTLTGSDKIYTYTQPVSFDSSFSEDASDIVFDHSLNEGSASGKKNKSGGNNAEETTKKADYSYIYSSYWYTSPQTDGDTRSISAFKFNEDKSYSVTHYVKKGAEDWNVSTEKGTFKIQNGELILSLEGSFVLDAENEEIFEQSDGSTTQNLTSRKYNSIQNTEDFFGL